MPGIENLANAAANIAAREAYQQNITSAAESVTPAFPGNKVPDVDFEQLIGALDTENAIPPEIAANFDPMGTTDGKIAPQINPGEEILRGLQHASNVHGSAVKNLVAATEAIKDKDTVSNADLIKLQVATMDFQLKNDLISKAAGSVSQGIQTLMKNQ